MDERPEVTVIMEEEWRDRPEIYAVAFGNVHDLVSGFRPVEPNKGTTAPAECTDDTPDFPEEQLLTYLRKLGVPLLQFHKVHFESFPD